jgi:hypothetical protein
MLDLSYRKLIAGKYLAARLAFKICRQAGSVLSRKGEIAQPGCQKHSSQPGGNPAQDQHEQVNMLSTAQFEACRSGHPQLQTVEDEI